MVLGSELSAKAGLPAAASTVPDSGFYPEN